MTRKYTWPLSDPKSTRVMDACLSRGFSFTMDREGVTVPYSPYCRLVKVIARGRSRENATDLSQSEFLAGIEGLLREDSQRAATPGRRKRTKAKENPS